MKENSCHFKQFETLRLLEGLIQACQGEAEKIVNEGMLKTYCKICYIVGTLSGGFCGRETIGGFKN